MSNFSSYHTRALTCTIAFILTALIFPSTGCAAIPTASVSYPKPTCINSPNPEPQLPAEFDSFVPPIDPCASTSTQSPATAEWTRTARPDETLIITGQRFSMQTNAEQGKDTRFLVFGQNTINQPIFKDARIVQLDHERAAVLLDQSLPTSSMYLLWPGNAAGFGNPIAINQTEAWWVGPNIIAPGETTAIFGRNLSHNGGQSSAWVYLKPTGNAAGVWLSVTSVNPYKVDFTLPADTPEGDYEIWAHNGHGGQYGWSGPLTINVTKKTAWTNVEYNVKNFGAVGNGTNDDEAAIKAALDAAQNSPGSTVYFPAGAYMVSRGFRPPSDVRWRGDGKEQSFIKLNSNFTKPLVYDERRYSLIFDSSSAKNIEIRDLTLDANGNLNGYLDSLIYLRGQSEISLDNVGVKAAGYKYFDLHLSSLISLRNCEMIGVDGFLGNARQVFIDGCNFYGTNDANTLLDSWGADGLSVTNSTARDFDRNSPTGWTQGRFVYGNGVWGSNRHIYLGGNQTFELAVRPAHSNQNSGEQFLWEGNNTVFTGNPLSASATTAFFGGLSGNYGDGRYEAVIIKGTGLGQHRRVIAQDNAAGSIKVSPAWNIPPDTNSTVIIAAVAEKIVLYHNSVDGKSDYLNRETASSGVQLYGNSYDFIADGNTIREVQTGLSTWATDENNTIQPCYFNLFANNDIQDAKTGALANVEYAQSVSNDHGVSYLGNTFRRNNFRRMSRNGLMLAGAGAPPGEQLLMNVIEHNSGTDLPIAIETSSRPSERRTITQTVIYQNSFDRGSAPAVNSAGIRFPGTDSPFALRQNIWSNFINTYAGTLSGPSLASPLHVYEISANADGQIVQTDISIWNVGPSPLNWNASSDASWLKVTPPSGTIADERNDAHLTLSADPRGLTAGTYSATMTIANGLQSQQYTVKLTVTAASVSIPPPTPVPIPSPTPIVTPALSRDTPVGCDSSTKNDGSSSSSAALPLSASQIEAQGSFTYTFADLKPGASYTICLCFKRQDYPMPLGNYPLDVAINSSPVLTNFDIYSQPDDAAKFLTRAFQIAADGEGKITISYAAIIPTGISTH